MMYPWDSRDAVSMGYLWNSFDAVSMGYPWDIESVACGDSHAAGRCDCMGEC